MIKMEKLNYYESVIMFEDLPEDKIKKKIEDYFIKILHGEELDIPTIIYTKEDLGVRRLAYDVKGESKGHYVKYVFETAPERIVELERFLRIDDDVLKFITLKLDELDEDINPDHVLGDSRNKTPAAVKSEQDIAQDAWDKIFN